MKTLGIIFLLIPFFASADVVINEIAWMGTETSTADEWIELYNNGSEAVSLEGWTLAAEDGTPSINLSASISAGGFFLLERTDDTTLPAIAADLIYTGALSNSGEVLILKNSAGAEIDKADASQGWPAGDNSTKQTMQRTSNGSWITATGTPKAENAVQPQPQPQQQEEEETDPSPNGFLPYVQPENLPSIKVMAGDNKEVITGAEVKFSGIGLGAENAMLENARFFWSFGDGSYKDGKTVSHIYQFPGQYLVSLNVSSGPLLASDRILVKVNKADLTISELKTGENGWIEIINDANKEVNVSGLKFKHNKEVFIFPPHSLLAAKSRVVVPEAVSNLRLEENQGEVGLFYANSWLIDNFLYQGILKEDESFNREFGNSGSYVAKQTPGEENNSPLQEISTLGVSPSTPSVSLPDESPAGRTPGVEKETPGIKEAGLQEIELKPQPAAVLETKDEEGSNFLKWFLISLAIGVLGAGGYLFFRHKSRSRFKVE